MTSADTSEAAVEAALRALYLTKPDSRLRPEEVKKIPEVSAFLGALARVKRDPVLVDAAAGRAYLGLLAARLLGVRRVTILERDPRRVAVARALAARQEGAQIEVRQGDVADRSIWPEAPEVVAALHACGPASDAVLDAAVAARARWLLLVPCCYADAVPFAAPARALADDLGLPRQAGVRRRFVESLIDAERTLRLEAAGYQVTVSAFVSPRVTPHNLLWTARRVGPGRRADEAAERLARLHQSGSQAPSQT
jgi:hypothetical protein